MRTLEVEGLCKSYGCVQALDGVDFDVGAGEIVALLGPNGAGKTTLVSIVAGLRKAERGHVRVGGVDAASNPSRTRRQLGFAPQEVGVYPTLTVGDNLRFFGELGGMRRRQLKDRIAEVAELFSLVDLLDRKGGALSGGEARRLHTAMIVLHSPPLLLLDEPTAGVDVQTRKQLLQLVASLADAGSAVVYSTHYLHEIEELGVSTVSILVEGRIAASDSIPRLVNKLGGAAVELRFHGRAPNLELPDETVFVGPNAVRVPASGSPAVTAAQLLQHLDGSSRELREIKLIQPSLESVFLAITANGAGGRDFPR